MATIRISLPDPLRKFIDEQVDKHGYPSASAYLCDLMRKDQDRQRLRSLLQEGELSAPSRPVDGEYFDGLRARATKKQ